MIQELRKIPQVNQVTQRGRVLENLKKKTKTERINNLFSELENKSASGSFIRLYTSSSLET